MNDDELERLMSDMGLLDKLESKVVQQDKRDAKTRYMKEYRKRLRESGDPKYFREKHRKARYDHAVRYGLRIPIERSKVDV